MTVAVRGTPAWADSFTAPSWPAGTVAGDIAFLFLQSQNKSLYTTTVYHERPSGWTSSPVMEHYDDGSNAYAFTVYRITVPAGGPAALPAPTTIGDVDYKLNWLRGMLVVFSGASAVDTIVTGKPYVQVAGYGAALCIMFRNITSLYANTSGVTDLPALSEVSAIWDNNTLATAVYVGWNSTVNSTAWAFEILPKAAPSKPTITTPAQSAQVGTGQNVPVGVTHNAGVPGGSAKAYRLRVRQNAGTWYYWNQSAGTLSSTTAVANTITGTSFTVTLPNAVITGATIELIAETQESLDDQWSPVSDTRTFTRVAPPTVVVTGPGALSGDLSPTVTWVTTPGIGSQTDYRVVITDATDAVLHDSGTLTGTAATHTAPGTTAWVSGATVTATVTVSQTGGAQATDTDTFSVSWTAPTAPTVAAAVAAQGVTVVVTAAASRLVRVWRRSGTTDTLLGAWETGADDVLTFTDVFGPTTAVTYRAQVWSDLDGVLLPSTVATSGSVTRTDRGCYIGSALDPAQTWRTADLESEADRTHIRPVGVVWPIGDTYSRTLSGPSRGKVGGFTQHVTHGVDAADMVALLESGETLLVRIPPETYGNAQSNAGQIIPLSVTSEVTESRQAQGPWARRILSWSWAERAWPDPSSSVAPVTHPATLT